MRLALLATLLLFIPALSQTEKAPDLTLKDVRGRTVRLSDYKGKVVLLNFWATWCAPCLAEMPELVKLQREHRERGLRIIGVSHPTDTPAGIARTKKRLKISYQLLLGDEKTLSLFEFSDVLPQTIVIDREGKVRDRILGILELDEFKQKVKPLLY